MKCGEYTILKEKTSNIYFIDKILNVSIVKNRIKISNKYIYQDNCLIKKDDKIFHFAILKYKFDIIYESDSLKDCLKQLELLINSDNYNL